MKKRNGASFRQSFLLTIFAAILFLSFGQALFGQTADSPDKMPEVKISERKMKRVVREIINRTFKPENELKTIYLADINIKPEWLPSIKNIEFRLLSIAEIKRQNIEVYFFTKPERAENEYSIGLANGYISCNYSGSTWYFYFSNRKFTLRQNGGFGSGCGAGNGN